jgi:hypothetical protein
MQVSSRLVHPAHRGYGAEIQRDKVVASFAFQFVFDGEPT